MTDNSELQKVAAYAAQDTIKFADEDEEMRALQQFHEEVDPETVLALIAENERLERKNANQSESIREYQDLVMGGDVSLGMLKADIRVTTGERDELRAEIAGLKTGYEAYERVNAGLKAENERLRREREGKVLCDLELFETLRDAANTEADEHRQCMATYRPLRQENLDSVVKKCDDLLAAMGQGEQS